MSLNLLNVIDWQRDSASYLINLLKAKQVWYDAYMSGFFKDWTRDVFNLDTANEFGQFVWSIILDVPLFGASDPDPDNQDIIYFNENGAPDNDRENFSNGNFGSNGASTYNLTPSNRRLVLKIRAVNLMTFHSTAQLNKRLLSVMGTPVFYYKEAGLMKLEASFSSFDKYGQLAMYLDDYDLFPRPCGVSIDSITYRS